MIIKAEDTMIGSTNTQNGLKAVVPGMPNRDTVNTDTDKVGDIQFVATDGSVLGALRFTVAANNTRKMYYGIYNPTTGQIDWTPL